MAVFVTADLHFNHPGILALERHQFNSTREHNQFIVDHWNEVVGKDDIVYVLGDVGFTPLDQLEPWIKQLKGHKILLKGNHDHINEGAARKLGFDRLIIGPYYYNSHLILSHEPTREAYQNPYVINVHGHLHNAILDLPNFYNVNIAQTDYYPRNIKYYEKIAQNCKDRHETFNTEWYSPFYKFIN